MSNSIEDLAELTAAVRLGNEVPEAGWKADAWAKTKEITTGIGAVAGGIGLVAAVSGIAGLMSSSSSTADESAKSLLGGGGGSML